jgi:hypothetical protein
MNEDLNQGYIKDIAPMSSSVLPLLCSQYRHLTKLMEKRKKSLNIYNTFDQDWYSESKRYLSNISRIKKHSFLSVDGLANGSPKTHCLI